MADAIAHRGPDAEGFYVEEPALGLAHRRLSIIDLASGAQPMGNEDGALQLVFNGEIYNYRELRGELLARGHRFRTQSDSETILHLYEDGGIEAVRRLRGMFAFALWDRRRQGLLLARDRFGQKPLYYACDQDRLVFGSELKAILAAGGFRREIDLQALEDYLAFGFVPGERSIFRGIAKVPPASTLWIDRRDWQPRGGRYWQLPEVCEPTRTVQQWEETLRDKLEEVVETHRISDVPLGSFLSGGLDSSAVTAILAGTNGTPVKTFSIGFEEARYSELEHAGTVAARFATDHTSAIVTADAVASLDSLTRFYDEPFADASAIPTMRVAELASQHVKVVLSGDGGDEGFAGYARHAHDLREAVWRQRMPGWFRQACLGRLAECWPQADWLPRPLRGKTTLTNLALPVAEAYANTLMLCRNPLRRQLLRPCLAALGEPYRPQHAAVTAFGSWERDPIRGMLATDMSIMLPDDFLTKVDRASMAYGLEVRPPLVDHEWMELAWQLPSEWKIRAGETKWMLKRIGQTWLPRTITHRSKQGFEIPLNEWLRGPLRELFHEVVLDPASALGSYLDLAVVRRLWEAHGRGSARHGNLLWSILVLAVWMERYLTTPLETSSAGAGTPRQQVVSR